MNFYKRHIGDYIKDTAHLSLLEHGVYCRLLDVYYSREEPLPDDQVMRLIGARSKDEKEAVNVVLSEFFTLSGGVWSNSRCDREIAAAQEKAKTNREIGKRGGRPKKETETDKTENPEKTQTVSENNPQETLASNHKPVTSNHKPEDQNTLTPTSSESPKAKRKTRIPDDFGLTPEREAAARAYWSTKNRADLDPIDEMEKFIAHHRGKGETYLDWDCVWQTWYSNAIKFNRPSLAVIPGKQNRHANFDQIDYTAGVNPDGSF